MPRPAPVDPTTRSRLARIVEQAAIDLERGELTPERLRIYRQLTADLAAIAKKGTK